MMITHNMAHAIEYGNRLLMMDREEKRKPTVDALVEKFHTIRRRDFESDEVRLQY